MMEGWKTTDLTLFPTVSKVQYHQYDGQMIVKGCVQRNFVYC